MRDGATIILSMNEYDTTPYPGTLFSQTSPDRLATIGRLHGMSPRPVESSRVLELGCGNGTNLIAMAYAAPHSHFVGIDLSEQAIRKGCRLIQSLNMTNVTLHHQDLLLTPEDLGEFDYIIAHGLYSWVPAPVRDKIMLLCHHYLSEQGIAYISYNAYPGNHLRDPVRRMIHYHVDQLRDPIEKVQQSKALIKLLAESKPEPGLWQTILHQQLKRMNSYSEEAFYHDDLSPTNHPVYFHEFAGHAARHGMQYLCEADMADVLADEFTQEIKAQLETLGSKNILAREQYLDFLKGRSFRQTLICRDSITLDRELKPERVYDLLIAGEVRPSSPTVKLDALSMEDFHGSQGAIIATDQPITKAALLELASQWPARIPFQQLLANARQRLTPHGTQELTDKDPEVAALTLGKFMGQCYKIGFIDLHVQSGHFSPHISERPKASALARFLSHDHAHLPTLRHTTLNLEDSVSRHMIRLLDGTRDQPTILRELKDAIASGDIVMKRGQELISDVSEATQLLERQFDRCLSQMARSGVLER